MMSVYYNNNKDIKEYVDRYCKTYGKSLEESLKDKVVHEYARYVLKLPQNVTL